MSDIPQNYQDASVSVGFNVYGYKGGLEKLTEELGLQPDQQHEKDGKKYPQDWWSFQSKLHASASIEEHLEWLLEALRPHNAKIKQIASKCEAKISIGATYYWHNTDFELEPSIVSGIADLGVKLWFDIYSFNREYMAEDFQKEHFKQILLSRKAAKKLGVDSQKEVEAITEVLHLLESYSGAVMDDFFPDDGLGREIDDEELAEALPNLRKEILRLLSAVKKSEFLSGESDS